VAPQDPDIAAAVETARAAGVDADFRLVGDLGRIDPIVGLSLHRVVEEALANARRHAPRAVTDVVWGLISTIGFLWAMSRLRGRASRRPIWIGLAAARLVLWLAATILSITLPVVETGTDPTRLPIGAMVAPRQQPSSRSWPA
jgi:hypothetical protein